MDDREQIKIASVDRLKKLRWLINELAVRITEYDDSSPYQLDHEISNLVGEICELSNDIGLWRSPIKIIEWGDEPKPIIGAGTIGELASYGETPSYVELASYFTAWCESPYLLWLSHRGPNRRSRAAPFVHELNKNHVEFDPAASNIFQVPEKNLRVVVSDLRQWCGFLDHEIESRQQEKIPTAVATTNARMMDDGEAAPMDSDALLSPKRLSELFDVPYDALRKRLERWRKTAGDGWIEDESRGVRNPQFLYRVGSVQEIIKSLAASSSRPAQKI